LEQICAGLIEHGCPPDLPAALIQQGTTRHQLVLTGTLSTLPAIVSSREVKAPTLVIVGEVVKLHEKLAWFRTAKPD
jgi:uroporphyrin-III C-methyltransferase/precorrin-2 dehydrogenase/sirohydrochlorin ferrochelatase